MKVVVVGAGPSGLVVCKTLLDAASMDFPFDPIILEQENNIGGTFRYRSYEVYKIMSRSTITPAHSKLRIQPWFHPSN
jgi:dimethylaniline monooxygenase (N-oxide forming)